MKKHDRTDSPRSLDEKVASEQRTSEEPQAMSLGIRTNLRAGGSVCYSWKTMPGNN